MVVKNGELYRIESIELKDGYYVVKNQNYEDHLIASKNWILCGSSVGDKPIDGYAIIDEQLIPLDVINAPITKRVWGVTHYIVDFRRDKNGNFVPVYGLIYDGESLLTEDFKHYKYKYYDKEITRLLPVSKEKENDKYNMACDEPVVLTTLLAKKFQEEGLIVNKFQTKHAVVVTRVTSDKRSIVTYNYTVGFEDKPEPDHLSLNLDEIIDAPEGEKTWVSTRTYLVKRVINRITLPDNVCIVRSDESGVYLSNGVTLRNNYRNGKLYYGTEVKNMTVNDNFMKVSDLKRYYASKIKHATTYNDPVNLVKRLYRAPMFVGPLAARVTRQRFVTPRGQLIIKKKDVSRVPEWVWDWVRYLFGMSTPVKRKYSGNVIVRLNGEKSSVEKWNFDMPMFWIGKTYFYYNDSKKCWFSNTNAAFKSFMDMSSEYIGEKDGVFFMAQSYSDPVSPAKFLPKSAYKKIVAGKYVSWKDFLPGLKMNNKELRRKGGEKYLQAIHKDIRWFFDYFEVVIPYLDGVLKLHVPYDNTVDVYSPMYSDDVPSEYVVEEYVRMSVRDWPEDTVITWENKSCTYRMDVMSRTAGVHLTLERTDWVSKSSWRLLVGGRYVSDETEKVAVLGCQSVKDMKRLISLL